jgi:hypothetical protein
MMWPIVSGTQSGAMACGTAFDPSLAVRLTKQPRHDISWPRDQLAWLTLGCKATPVARMTRLAAGRGAERTMKQLPCCSTSVTEPRSAMILGHEPGHPSLGRRSFGTFFSTGARKQQNQRIVASRAWRTRPCRKRAAWNAYSVVHNCSSQHAIE